MPSVGWGGVTLMSGRRIYLLMWCQGKIMGFLRDLSWKRIKNLGKVREKTSKIVCINPDFEICDENVLKWLAATGFGIKTDSGSCSSLTAKFLYKIKFSVNMANGNYQVFKMFSSKFLIYFFWDWSKMEILKIHCIAFG